MWKKIRQLYWYKRDRGKGKEVLLGATFLLVFVLLIVAVGVKSVINNVHEESVAMAAEDTHTGTSIGTSVATEGTVSGNMNQREEVHEEVPGEVPAEIVVDTSGMENFLGFMTDSAYKELETKLIAECKNRGCNKVEKLNYQKTKENSFEVISFVLLGDGSVYQCNYNLKSNTSEVSLTEYNESAIMEMQQKEIKAEQEALEKQQKVTKKKLAQKKRYQKKKAKKTSKKKTSKKKSKRK